MDVPRIRRNLERLPAATIKRSPTLLLLQGTCSPLPTGQNLKTVLRDVSLIYRMFQIGRDFEGMAAAAVLAASAIWDFGTSFSLFEKWRKRIESLSADSSVSPLARSSLLAFNALFAIFFRCDLKEAMELLASQRKMAEEAKSAALILYGASLEAMASTYAGEVERAHIVLEEASPFFNRVPAGSHTRLYYRILKGLVENASGRPDRALNILETAREMFPPEDMRSSMSLLLEGIYLLAASLDDKTTEISLIEKRVRELAVLDGVHFYASLMHASLALGYLRQGRPYRALLHSENGERCGKTAESFSAAGMNRLTRALALVDLNETAEAFTLLRQVHNTFREKGFGLYRNAAALELASLYTSIGELDQAHTWMDEAEATRPKGEECYSSFRPSEFTVRLKARLRPEAGKVIVEEGENSSRPICIHSLGEFYLSVKGERLYDRRWGTGRTQRLLKLILAMGGSHVPVCRLIELLWPDADGDVGMSSFKTAMARLRSKGSTPGSLRLKWLYWKQGRISLSRNLVWADSMRFEEGCVRALETQPDIESLTKLTALYEGDFLRGDDDFPEIQNRRIILREAHVKSVEKLSETLLSAGSKNRCLEIAAHAVSVNPCSERLYALKMRLQLDRGFHADALQTYRNAASALQSFYNTPPGEELRRLADLARMKSR